MELSEKRRSQLTFLFGAIISIEALIGVKLLLDGQESSATVIFSTIMMWSSAVVLLNAED